MNWNILKDVGKVMNLTSQYDSRTPNAGLYRSVKFGKKCGGYGLSCASVMVLGTIIIVGAVELFTKPPHTLKTRSDDPYRRSIPKR